MLEAVGNWTRKIQIRLAEIRSRIKSRANTKKKERARKGKREREGEKERHRESVRENISPKDGPFVRVVILVIFEQGNSGSATTKRI